ncbi:hypothetical protein [Achromobacter pestifer]
MSKGLRDQMPEVATFVDTLRDIFGKASIDGQIRRGLAGEPVFYASENGHEIGTPLPGIQRLQPAVRNEDGTNSVG